MKTRGSAQVQQLDFPYQTSVENRFLQLSKLEGCVWLDSGRPESNLGRYDILSALPSTQTNTCSRSNVIADIEERLKKIREVSDLPFCGGWIGYFGYTYRHTYYNISSSKVDTLPTTHFGWYDWALVMDHRAQRGHLVFQDTCSPATRERVLAALASRAEPETYRCGGFAADESREHYLASLAKIREYLLAGDCYQVNYTQRFSARFLGSAPSSYLTLRRTVPSPFAAYLSLPRATVLSISPERFIQLQDRRALTQPIKGTAPRGKTPAEDLESQTHLRSSVKNQAENLMIVDLLRNDFSMNCLPNTVKVPQLFELQSFSNVHHLVSTITGTLKPHVGHAEFIEACFPGGSITGAPKKRAMEIIEELECHSRSIYCGAIGYFSTNGNSDFNIAIRTLLLQGETLHAWAGGGIVVDSVPDLEYEESLHKIGPLLAALAEGSGIDPAD